jgi:hypothetical protein
MQVHTLSIKADIEFLTGLFQYSKDKEQYLECDLDGVLEDEADADEDEEAVDDPMTGSSNDEGRSQTCEGLMSPRTLAGREVEGSPRSQSTFSSRVSKASTPYHVSAIFSCSQQRQGCDMNVV